MRIIALDLEASLIDNAMMGNPRPGLYAFLEFCFDHFERVVLLTTVPEEDARDVLRELADKGEIPDEFAEVEYVNWEGEYKDLRYVPNAKPNEILFVDDDRGWVLPEQIEYWIQIAPWDSGDDTELQRTKQTILARVD